MNISQPMIFLNNEAHRAVVLPAVRWGCGRSWRTVSLALGLTCQRCCRCLRDSTGGCGTSLYHQRNIKQVKGERGISTRGI